MLCCGQREQQPLNLVLITLDTTRADHLGCYGSRSGASPAIDAFASRAVRFEQADSVVPLTLPSHATLLTGLQPQRHGLRLNSGGTLRGSVETLATVLSRHGFQTGAFVGSRVLDHRFGLARGFGTYDDAVKIDSENAPEALDGERPAGAVADAALAWLRGTGTRPFFAWIHFYDAHAPYAPPQPYRTRFASSPYDGEIAYADSQIARILEYLDRARLREHTVVAIAGDHGEGLGEHGEATHGLLLYESTLRVPLIIAAPSLLPHVVHESISTTDVAPTLAALSGVAMNVVRLDGRDLSADLVHRREPPPRDIYAETRYPRTFGWSDLGAFRRDGKKLISGTLDELFDLDGDPHETANILEGDRQMYRQLAAALVPLRRRGVPAPDRSRSDPRSMMVEFHSYENALRFLDERKFRAAIQILEPLTKLDAANAVFRVTLARAYEGEGNVRAAIVLDRESIGIDPSNADAWYGLAASRLGRNGAAAEFRRATAIDVRDAHAYNDLGDALRDQGQAGDAILAYHHSAALDPSFEAPRISERALLARPRR